MHLLFFEKYNSIDNSKIKPTLNHSKTFAARQWFLPSTDSNVPFRNQLQTQYTTNVILTMEEVLLALMC